LKKTKKEAKKAKKHGIWSAATDEPEIDRKREARWKKEYENDPNKNIERKKRGLRKRNG
jgi:hypothetical protein